MRLAFQVMVVIVGACVMGALLFVRGLHAMTGMMGTFHPRLPGRF